MSVGDRFRILFISSQFAPLVGGVETQSEHLARALSSRGEEIDILTMTVPGSPRCEEGPDFTLHRAIRVVPVRGLWGASHMFWTLLFLLRRGRRYRLVLCYQMQAFHNPVAVAWGKMTRRPVLVCGGGSGFSGDFQALKKMISGRLLRYVLRWATSYVALNREMREEMMVAGLAPEKITVIPNGVDTGIFKPFHVSDRARESLVFVGRLSLEKGPRFLLEAFSRLAPGRSGLTLRFLGDGPEKPFLRKLALELGVDERVVFEGVVSAARVKNAMAAAAVVVQPSLAEGVSCAILEAMAMGCAIVTTDIPANRTLIEEGEEGLLVPPRDVPALAGAIAGILDDPAAAVRMGRTARRRVEEDFAIETIAARYAGLFHTLCREGRV